MFATYVLARLQRVQMGVNIELPGITSHEALYEKRTMREADLPASMLVQPASRIHAGGETRTPTGREPRQILSLLRLPISPRRLWAESVLQPPPFDNCRRCACLRPSLRRTVSMPKRRRTLTERTPTPLPAARASLTPAPTLTHAVDRGRCARYPHTRSSPSGSAMIGVNARVKQVMERIRLGRRPAE